MSLYESVFIMRQDVSSQDINAITKAFVTIVEEMGGVLVKKEYWGLRTLAYVIKKNKRGHYMMLGFKAEHDAMKELERHYKMNEDIIKFVTFRVDKIDDGPSPMMQAPSEDTKPGAPI